MELAAEVEAFRKRGIGVAAVVPEPPETLKAFAERFKITFPLLADRDAVVVRRFNLVDPDFRSVNPPRENVPYAGNFLLDAQGVIQAKFFEKATENRRTAGSVLILQGDEGKGGQQIHADQFSLRTSASNQQLSPGQRFTLAIDVEMKPQRHAYAPGVKGYRPLDLRLDATPILEPHPTVFPSSRSYFFAPLEETVPVFEGRFRVVKDVTLSFREGRRLVAETPEAPLEITGALDHQVCSDTLCYPPGSIPLRWTLTVRRFVK